MTVYDPNAWREDASEYERGFIDGMQKQMQSSVDKAVNAMGKREWVSLTDEEIDKIRNTPMSVEGGVGFSIYSYARAIEAKLKEKNNV